MKYAIGFSRRFVALFLALLFSGLPAWSQSISEMQSIKSLLLQAKNEIAALQAQLAISRKDLSEARELLSASEASLQVLEQKWQSLESRYQELVASYQTQTKAWNELQVELTAYKESLMKLLDSLKEQLAQAKSETIIIGIVAGVGGIALGFALAYIFRPW